jgi:hypothetical protein
MEPISHKLQHRTGEEVEHKEENSSHHDQAGRSFEQVEDLLRHDAAKISLPAGLEDRLRASAASVTPPRRHWWNRLFCR